MILKIMTDRKEDSYWMMDGIRKINRSGIFLKSNLPHDYNYDIALFMTEKEDQYTELICRGENTDSEFTLATDCVIYVLNDSGKTVQRILNKY